MSLAARHRSLTPVETLFVITGCSGAGKSTLLAALEAAGEHVVPEPGRRVLRSERARGGDGLPWTNLLRFTERCAELSLEDFDRHRASGVRTFFDRSPLDHVAGLARTGLPLPERVREAVASRRYAPLVFVAPPWRALFHSDDERRHSFEEAVAEYGALEPTYRAYGYETITLPQACVSDRVTFVLATLAQGARVER